MHSVVFAGRRIFRFALLLCMIGFLAAPSIVAAESKFVIKALAEKKLKELPSGPLYWQIENFPTLAQAKAAEGPTSLAAEAAGKTWLFTLGTKGAPTHGGAKVVEIGPVPPIQASEYLLRINYASGAPGAKTRIHTHPGSEAFYVLSGQLGQTTPHGVSHADVGQFMPGHGPGMPMQVFSNGKQDLSALVMFVVDATKPFSSPAEMK